MKSIHMIGIGGTGLSAIARVLLESGYTVSGSDQQDSAGLQQLAKLGATIYIGHAAHQVAQVDLVVRSSAIPDTNPEVIAAQEKNIAVLKRADFLSTLIGKKKCIAISGTHGKTTTTAMIAWMLHELQLDPSYIIGSDSKDLGNNAHAGSSDYFVIEADEYDRMFHGLTPYMGILTNLEHDHPDCYPSMADYEEAFMTYINKIIPEGKLIFDWDDAGNKGFSKNFSPKTKVIRYAVSSQDADKQAQQVILQENGCYRFEYPANDDNYIPCHLQVPGLHNVHNAMAAMIVAEQLELNLYDAAAALEKFSGTGRRMEIIGETQGITIIDDYAHHPTEIETTLKALRERYPNRIIWTVWQPHTYSRTMTLFDKYVDVFKETDHLIITPVYAARETNPGFNIEDLVNQLKNANSQHIDNFDKIRQYLTDNMKADDILIVLSAGDAIQISSAVYKTLSERSESA
ncbi:MAG: UDP-N-acetylmuramate--L-alanine ligase [Anaerolineaceae bacterium]|nr:UDP-N-acetylmuramate--L-alanine ligase [Anaerolineaceae bacterium]